MLKVMTFIEETIINLSKNYKKLILKNEDYWQLFLLWSILRLNFNLLLKLILIIFPSIMICPVLDQREIHTEKENQGYRINYYQQDIIRYLKEDKTKVREKRT